MRRERRSAALAGGGSVASRVSAAHEELYRLGTISMPAASRPMAHASMGDLPSPEPRS